MQTTTQAARTQATTLASGAIIKTAKPGDRLRFGNGLYLLVSPTGTKSWQVHYHVAGRHQATIVGRWPDLGVTEAKAKREEIRKTIRAGGDPAHDRREQRISRMQAEVATVRSVGNAWIETAQVARGWSADYVHHTTLRLRNHVFPVIGDRPIGRVSIHEIQSLIYGLKNDQGQHLRSQAVHVRQHLQLLWDYAMRRKLATENPVRAIAEDLPKRVRGDEAEVSRAHVTTIEEARTVLRAIEESSGGPFTKLVHRLIALTAVRKLEGVEAQWSEITEGPDGMVWTVPGARMKGRRGQKRSHTVPLSPQAADVFRAARELASLMGLSSPFVFPGERGGSVVSRSRLNAVYDRALPGTGLTVRHTVHGWRSTFSTILNERDFRDERVIDMMLAHRPIGVSLSAKHYDKAELLKERRRLGCVWADLLMRGAPSAYALAGLHRSADVVPLREAA